METILIVDDEPAICRLVTEILSRQGYEAVPAAGPEEALLIAQTRSDAVSLLISDVRMPGMNGPELNARLKSRWPTLKVLFMSGHTDLATVVEPLLPKPFTAAQLLGCVRELMGC